MLSENEFDVGLSRLASNYHKKYDMDQRQELWGRFCSMEPVAWKALIDKLLETEIYLPRIATFYKRREIAAEDSGTIGREQVPCPTRACNGLGLRWGVFLYPEINQATPYIGVARCSCPNGDTWAKIIPTVPSVERNKNSGLIAWETKGNLEKIRTGAVAVDEDAEVLV